jgi:ankyrin repeat protein
MRVNMSVLAGCCLVSLLSVAPLVSAADDTRLADAAKRHDLDAVRALLKQQANVNAAMPDGTTALHWAAQWDDADLANMLLLAKANVDAADVYGVTPLSLACTNGSPTMVARLLRSGANPNTALPSGETPLMTASRTGRPKAVSSLLEAGANVNAQEATRGQTALMWAAAERNLEVVKLLIEKGANVSAKAKSGFTPLLFAAQRGDSAITDVLLKSGVDVNEAANNGMTALVLAIAADQNEHAIYLLGKGANPNLGPGYAALHLIAAEEGYVEGAEGEEGGGGSGTLWGPAKLDFIKLLLSHGANVNAATTRAPKGPGTIGATPFFLAAWAADPDAMRLLLANGADPKVTTPQGTTPLMVAAGVFRQAGGPNVPETRALEAVKLCVELGNDVNAVNASHGDTALHGAAYRGMHGGAKITQFLLEKGAKVDVKNKRDWTPYMIAEGLYFSTYNTINVETANILRIAGASPFPPGFPTNTGIRSSEIWYEPGFEPATLGSEGASRVK